MTKKLRVTRPNYFKALRVAVEIAKKIGLKNTSVLMIAKEMGIHHTLIYSYHSSMASLRSKVVDIALDENIPEIIFEALISGAVKKEQLSDENKKILTDFIGDDEKPVEF